MSGVEPYDATDRSLMWTLAGLWIRDRPVGGSGSRFVDWSLEPFPAVQEATLLEKARRLGAPLDTGSKFGWIIGRSLSSSETSTPVTTIQLAGTAGNITGCCIRTAIFYEREDGTVGADGWRFETAETTKGAIHPYQHAQAIIGWNISSKCLVHPPGFCGEACPGIDPATDGDIDRERIAARNRINQSHPAFPFLTSSLTGLVAVAMTTFYGASAVRRLVREDPRLERASGAVRTDLRALLG